MQGRARSWRRAGARSPVDWKTPGLHWQYRCAKASIIRSIFCASPGSRKLHRNCLRTAGTALLWGSVHPPALRALQGTQLTARPPSAPRSPQCLDEVEVRELVQLHEGVQDLDVELIPAGTKPEHEVLCVISRSCDCRAAPCPALPSAPLGVGNWWLWAALQPGLHTAAPPRARPWCSARGWRSHLQARSLMSCWGPWSQPSPAAPYKGCTISSCTGTDLLRALHTSRPGSPQWLSC